MPPEEASFFCTASACAPTTVVALSVIMKMLMSSTFLPDAAGFQIVNFEFRVAAATGTTTPAMTVEAKIPAPAWRLHNTCHEDRT